ncbi:MAG: hypothetical protein HC865_22270 [Cyanobacteria bacterium RU_5_0]|nr:hypothetical protein [Cyanobacteria bacterium RU_5_0]
MATLSPNVSITVNQRRWSCVLDPNLFLSHYGLLLVQLLGEVLELWVARELWQIVDNPNFYGKQLALTIPRIGSEQALECQTVVDQNRMQVLKRWESVRSQTPPTQLNLFWIGDKPGESFLPDGVNPQLLEPWEALAQSLEERSQPSNPSNMLTPAFRDTAALTAALGCAFILTYPPTDNRGDTKHPPEICLVLEEWGIPCQQVDSLDAIAAIERETLLQLMISTGFSNSYGQGCTWRSFTW